VLTGVACQRIFIAMLSPLDAFDLNTAGYFGGCWSFGVWRRPGRFWLRVIHLFWLEGASVAPCPPAIPLSPR